MSEQPWIVVPCFNEAARLDRGAFERVLRDPRGPVFVFVDDGSTDGTLEVLRSLRHAPGRCHVLPQPRNRGKGEAVRQGMLHALDAGASCVGYWDADLATPLPVIEQFFDELRTREQIEGVMGARVRLLGRLIDRSGFRHVVGRVYATAASLVLRLPVYDTQCGAKLFRTSAALAASLRSPFRSRWAFDVELIMRLQHAWGDTGDGRLLEVPLLEWRDVAGSKVSFRAGVRAFLSLVGLALRPPRTAARVADDIRSGAEGARSGAGTTAPLA